MMPHPLIKVKELNTQKMLSQIAIQISYKCNCPDDFEMKPKPSFYKKIGINQKRWGQLMKGSTIANVIEIRAISEYFSIPINNLI